MSLDRFRFPQVCSLPPAWGYEHCGLERFLLSFPWSSQSDGRPLSRLIKQETDQALFNLAKRQEDRMAFAFAFFKLLKGLRVSCHGLFPSSGSIQPRFGCSSSELLLYDCLVGMRGACRNG